MLMELSLFGLKITDYLTDHFVLVLAAMKCSSLWLIKVLALMRTLITLFEVSKRTEKTMAFRKLLRTKR